MRAFTMFDVSAAWTLFRKLEESCPLLPMVKASTRDIKKIPTA
jgi:hypothetical protein